MGTPARASRGPEPVRPAPGLSTLYPVAFTLSADRDLRVAAGGRVLLGGSPAKLIRLRPRAAETALAWREGGPVEDRRADRSVARRLVTAGIMHPRPPVTSPGRLVTVVVPVRDRPELLATLLGSLGKIPCVVVDDGSLNRAEIEKVARGAGAHYLRLDPNSGPAAARNAGLAQVHTSLVAFVDSDCAVPVGWLDSLVGHFTDPVVAMVAPRVLTLSASSALGRYESTCSPLDLGPREGRVAPGTRLSYVPSAAVVVRRAAIPRRCFDERLRFGEDADLVWRVARAGWDVRYEPAVEVTHTTDLRPVEWALRRARYGSSAGPLA
ncbi:MAG: mycofactocin biosynthesis glycosyltransferase MftF, partial [Acidimicrobiales bacterium]